MVGGGLVLAALKWGRANPLAVLLGIAVVVAGVQTFRLTLAEAREARAVLAFSDFKRDLAEKSAEAERQNAARSAASAQRLADDFMALTTTASEVKEALNAAKSTGACERDPKWRATVDGMQRMRDAGRARRDQAAPDRP